MWAWLVSIAEKIGVFVIGSVLEWVSKWIAALWIRHEKEIEQEKQAEHYKEVISDPNATSEEKKDAADKLLNS